jgi:GNAT superfamily N-acetyltransferase
LERLKDSIHFIKIENIREEKCLEDCVGLTWKSYRPFLEAAQCDNRLALAACAGSVPVGLWLSARTPSEDTPKTHTLLSLFVAPEWRRRGLATDLMQAAEGELSALGISSVTTGYSSILPGADAMSCLLRKQSWAEPVADRIRICGRVGDTFATSRAWALLLKRLQRQGVRYLSWEEAGDGVLEQAAAMVDAGEAPAWSDPRPWKDALSAEFSLAIFDGARGLAGWVICERQEKLDRWYFPIGWVTPPEQDRGTLVGAYLEGSMRIQTGNGASALAVLEASPRQGRAWRLFEKHFSTLALWSDRLLISQKNLGIEPTLLIE